MGSPAQSGKRANRRPASVQSRNRIDMLLRNAQRLFYPSRSGSYLVAAHRNHILEGRDHDTGLSTVGWPGQAAAVGISRSIRPRGSLLPGRCGWMAPTEADPSFRRRSAPRAAAARPSPWVMDSSASAGNDTRMTSGVPSAEGVRRAEAWLEGRGRRRGCVELSTLAEAVDRFELDDEAVAGLRDWPIRAWTCGTTAAGRRPRRS